MVKISSKPIHYYYCKQVVFCFFWFIRVHVTDCDCEPSFMPTQGIGGHKEPLYSCISLLEIIPGRGEKGEELLPLDSYSLSHIGGWQEQEVDRALFSFITLHSLSCALGGVRCARKRLFSCRSKGEVMTEL